MNTKKINIIGGGMAGNTKAKELANVWDRFKSFAKLMPYLGTLGKYMKMMCKECSERFKNPLLK